MSTTHDRDESTSRPDDPVGAAAGKTTREGNQPSRQHKREPPPDNDDEPPIERLGGGDLLVGADAIRAYLVFLGMPDPDPYYLRRTKRWPIGNTASGSGGGGKL